MESARGIRRLVLVRHGETEGESSIRYHGVSDVALSALGREQVHRARERLPCVRFDQVVASPLSRALESAEILVPGAKLHIEPRFREIDFGRWEGLTAEEIAARDPELYHRWLASPARFDFPEGEARAEFRARVAEGLSRVLVLPGPEVLAAVHKGVIRHVVELLCEHVPAQPWPDLGHVTELRARGDGRWQRLDP